MRTILCFSIYLLFRATAEAELRVSANQRYLVDEQGVPFLLTGDAAWSLIAEPNYAAARLYLEDRSTRRFNLVMVNLIEHVFGAQAPANANGDAPFVGPPFTTPNEAYFAHADSVIQAASDLDIVVLLAPVYLGSQCGAQGWCAEVQTASLSDMRTWGRFLGQRYASFDNLIWLIGGDSDPTGVADKLREVVLGIREYDTKHLMTAHNQPESEAITPWAHDDWVQLNSVYTYGSALYVPMLQAYENVSDLPLFLLESAYENERNSTPASLRAQSHWALLSGGFGHIFGNCPIWFFGYSHSWCGLADWMAALGEVGSAQMTRFRNLYESRRWYNLIPDTEQQVLIEGHGIWGSEDYATAARASDGSSIMIYLPSPRQLTVDTNQLSGIVTSAWWYDAASGAATHGGYYLHGLLTFPPHASGDWVLVLDDVSLQLPPPGTVPTSIPSAISGLRLEPNRPNPFNPSTTLRFELERASETTVTIYDARGRLLTVLADGWFDAGGHEIRWDGRDAAGVRAASGNYYVRVRTADAVQSRKLVLVE